MCDFLSTEWSKQKQITKGAKSLQNIVFSEFHFTRGLQEIYTQSGENHLLQILGQ